MKLFSILSPIVIAFAIAFLLLPLCRKCENSLKKLKLAPISSHARGLAVGCVYIAVSALIAAIIYLLVPTLIDSIAEFVTTVPNMLTTAMDMINRSEYIEIDAGKMYEYIEKIISRTELVRPSLYTSTIASLSKWIVNIFLSVIMSIYILLDRDSLVSFVKMLSNLFISGKKQSHIKKYAGMAAYFVYKYFYCSVLDAAIIFMLSIILLAILKVRYAPVLALTLGIFNLVPYFGSVFASVIAVIVTIITSGISKAAIVGISLLVLQQIDANVISPHLIKETLAVKPFWVLTGVFVGGGLFGIWGIILSVPFMALVKTLVYDFIKQN